MYQNYIFDLYGTLLDIHTDETGIRVWYVMQKRFRDAGVCAGSMSGTAVKRWNG